MAGVPKDRLEAGFTLIELLVALLLVGALLLPVTATWGAAHRAWDAADERHPALHGSGTAATLFLRDAGQAAPSGVALNYLGRFDAGGDPLNNNVELTWRNLTGDVAYTARYWLDSAEAALVRERSERVTATGIVETSRIVVARHLDPSAAGGGVWFERGSSDKILRGELHFLYKGRSTEQDFSAYLWGD